MKLRIKGNSLRLRVSRSELARLLDGDRIEETIRFTAAPEATLTYALASAMQSAPVSVEYGFKTVTVVLANNRARTWGSEGEVGVYGEIDNGEGGVLEVIVEKDFACLDRSDEDNADTFANPYAGTTC
jgi:hypothetical protein